jgi:hypothetical protein
MKTKVKAAVKPAKTVAKKECGCCAKPKAKK